MKRTVGALGIALAALAVGAEETAPRSIDLRLYDVVEAVSAERLETDIRRLAGFGTRHTLSETESDTRGIGAARRFIRDEFERISTACDGCLEIEMTRNLVKGGESERIPEDTWIVNVVAIQRGTTHPERYVIMSGDIDSRVTDPLDGTSDSPGANDNATGMAGALEAARVLSRYRFPASIVYVGLSGEEQGLFGGKFMAEQARADGWTIVGVLNNDMIGNIEGIDGVVDNRSYRIFSEANSPTDPPEAARLRRFYGGEVDGPSRQLARYVHRMSESYMPEMNPILIYRLDRFGRGGHHRPFNDAGFPGVRIMEAHEHYDRQHQDLRVENGVHYGDVVEGVNFDFAAKLTAVNAISLAGLAWAPPEPRNLRIGGAVQPSTTLAWDAVDDPRLAGYKVYWRATTAPQWQHSRFVGQVTTHTLRGIVIDNFLFGVTSVATDGNESVVVFPGGLIPRP
jgi:Zn-dependent M28 family amino/carboxypeptidase